MNASKPRARKVVADVPQMPTQPPPTPQRFVRYVADPGDGQGPRLVMTIDGVERVYCIEALGPNCWRLEKAPTDTHCMIRVYYVTLPARKAPSTCTCPDHVYRVTGRKGSRAARLSACKHVLALEALHAAGKV